MKSHFIKKFLYELLLAWRYVNGRIKHYHSGNSKSKPMILADLIRWQFREHEFNKMYYAFGLNISGRDQNDYIGRREFLRLKQRVEDVLKKKNRLLQMNYDVITKDKFYATSILSANGIRCIPNKAVICGGKILFPGSRSQDLNAFLGLRGTYYVKNTTLEAGDGVYQCRIMNDHIVVNDLTMTIGDFKQKMNDQVWVVQEQHRSHPGIRQVNSTALNTTRIVTIMNGAEPEYLTGFQAFATGDSTTDSWSGNSIYVGFDLERSCLREFGYCNLDEKNNSIVSVHPDSGIRFEDYPIPFLKEAVELCIRAHSLLFYNFVVGWDVAITDQGPLVVEANEKPGMNAVQCIDGGLRMRIKSYAGKYLV